MGTQLPPQKGKQPPNFRPMSIVAKSDGWIKVPLGTKVGLGPGDTVLDGIQLPQNGHSPQFSAYVYYGQMAVRIRILLGMEIGLSLGDIVLDGDPPPLPKGSQPPIFGQCPLWPNSWMD